jgi:hypothetical protein
MSHESNGSLTASHRKNTRNKGMMCEGNKNLNSTEQIGLFQYHSKRYLHKVKVYSISFTVDSKFLFTVGEENLFCYIG